MNNHYSSTGHHVEEIKIPVPWGHIAGRWWGPRDKQPIIATHGWQDNAGTYDNLIPLLPPTLSVLCIDLPGMGLSSHYPTGMLYYKFWDGIVHLRRIVRHYKWEKVTLMGHSLGGAVSFMYAATFPDEVERLICIDIASPAVQAPSETAKTLGASIDQTLKYEEMAKNEVIWDSYSDMIDNAHHAYKGSVSKDNCKVLMKRGMTWSTSRIKKQGYYFNRDPKLKFATLGMISLPQALEYADKIKCKVLNIRAIPPLDRIKDDYYKAVVNKLKETTDVTYFEVEGTHHVHLETPDKIVKVLNEFLNDLL